MAEALPPELGALLAAEEQAARDAAWAHFVSLHTGLLLQAARSFGRDYDAAMDRYTYALDRLRERNFHRLRSYQPDGRTRFSTWLLVVFRRLCLDHYRQRYGRTPDRPDPGAPIPMQSAERGLRRRLADGLAEEVDPESLETPGSTSPEEQMFRRHRRACLDTALGALSSEDRLLLQFRFEEGLSAREIARLTGVPSQFHVYRRLNALYASLRRALRSEGIDGFDA